MKAVIYARVSTAEQVENFSLETQQKACSDYCEREDIEVDAVFVEEGESAKTADRPRLREALDHCQARRKEVDYFVVYGVSRLARNVADHTAIRMALDKLGIRLRSVTETLDESATGKLVETLLAGIAQFDNDQRAARTIEGMRAALAKGRWTHQPPLGYRKPLDATDAPSLVPDPERARRVQLVFERIA